MQSQQNIIQFIVVTIFFSFCLCNKEYDYNVRIEAGVAPRPEKHREVDLKDGEYGYKIYYDDGDYDFDDDSSQDEQEKNDGLCMIVNQTNKEIQQRNNKALEKMEKYMEIYVLANSLRDYAQEVKKTMNDSSTNLTKEVDDAVESAQRDHIDIEDLTYLYKTLVAIPDGDKAFKNGTDWKKFVIFQLESVKDYIGEHFQHFKRELPKFKTSRQFYKRRNFYVKLGDRGGLMSIFYYWFDSRVCKPRMFDEAQIREKLKEHLKYLIDLPEHENGTESEKNGTKPDKESATLSGEGKDEDKGTDEKPGDEKPGDEKPGEEKPGDEKPGEEKPDEEKPGEEKPGEEKPGEEKPGEEKPGEEKPGEEKPGEDKPGEDKPGEDKPDEEKPGEEKPGEEKPADDKPADDKPEEEKPAEEKPADDKPADDKPADDKPDQENQAKSADDKPDDDKDDNVRTSAGPGGKTEK